jgi:hypothetical protein
MCKIKDALINKRLQSEKEAEYPLSDLKQKFIVFCKNKNFKFAKLTLDEAIILMMEEFTVLRTKGFFYNKLNLPDSANGCQIKVLIVKGEDPYVLIRHISVYDIEIDDMVERLDILMIKQ